VTDDYIRYMGNATAYINNVLYKEVKEYTQANLGQNVEYFECNLNQTSALCGTFEIMEQN